MSKVIPLNERFSELLGEVPSKLRQEERLKHEKMIQDHMRMSSIAQIAMIFGIILSFITTMLGIQFGFDSVGFRSFPHSILALMMSVTSAVMLGWITIYLSKLAAGDNGKHSLKDTIQLVLITAAAIPFVFGISTINSMVGTGGPPALVYNLDDLANDWGKYSHERSRELVTPRGAFNSIGPIEKQICDLSEMEAENGILSGGAGRGAISTAYAGACSSLTEMTTTLASQVDVYEERRKDRQKSIQSLRKTAYDQRLDVFERRATFVETTDGVEASLASSLDDAAADSLKAQLNTLAALVPDPLNSDTEFGRKQQRAVNGLRNSLTKVSDALAPVLNRTSSIPKADLKRPDGPAYVYEALWQYKGRLTTSFALAIAIDTFVVFASLMLGFSQSRINRAEAMLHSNPNWLGDRPLQSGQSKPQEMQ